MGNIGPVSVHGFVQCSGAYAALPPVTSCHFPDHSQCLYFSSSSLSFSPSAGSLKNARTNRDYAVVRHHGIIYIMRSRRFQSTPCKKNSGHLALARPVMLSFCLEYYIDREQCAHCDLFRSNSEPILQREGERHAPYGPSLRRPVIYACPCRASPIAT